MARATVPLAELDALDAGARGCPAVRPGTLGYQSCRRVAAHPGRHLSQDGGEWLVCGDLFTRTDSIDAEPCPHCGDPIVELYDGPAHFVVDPNGAKTSWGPCKTGDQGALFGV